MIWPCPVRITLEKEADVIINEKIAKIPLNLSNKTATQITFIQGAVMRNLFIPKKDVFLEMMNCVRDPTTFNPKTSGHKLYSTLWDDYNKILVSDSVGFPEECKYFESMAGISEIKLGADKLLQEIFSPEEIDQIDEKIMNLKKVLTNINFEPSYLFSLIQNAATALNDITIAPHSAFDSKKSKLRQNILSWCRYIRRFFYRMARTIQTPLITRN